ncbi:MAG: HAD-IA family hydrolase [Rhodospirillales bacterium]|jgi:HAD superfamily hydrolase (TIGR01509 family)
MPQEAARFLAAQDHPVRMVIFDCDGVLIDSEGLTDRVVAASLSELGWNITPDECHRRFLGTSFYDMVPLIETAIGNSLAADWVDRLVDRLIAVFAREVEPIPGARDALEGVTALGLPWRIASNSSFKEMDAKFSRAGWTDLVRGRLHSGVEIIARGGRSKPAPDIFLEAAAAEGIDPAHCLVIEDSATGARAARAAGMACLGYSPDNASDALRAAGAIPFRPMHALPALLRATR